MERVGSKVRRRYSVVFMAESFESTETGFRFVLVYTVRKLLVAQYEEAIGRRCSPSSLQLSSSQRRWVMVLVQISLVA